VAQTPKVLYVGTTQSLDSLNPYGTALVVGYEAFLLTYDMLVGFGPDLSPRPGFAESWQRAADGQSYTFTFRPGMRWSDGQPATAQDACFSYQLNIDAIEAESFIGLGYIDPGVTDSGITSVECPDDRTMIMHTSDPSDRPLQNYVPILPRHIWGDMTFEEIGDASFDAPLVGSGPYTVTEWRTGEYTRFVRNPNYWGEQGAADEVVIRYFGTSDTMTQALRAGEIDYARGLTAEQMAQVATEPNIQTIVGRSNGWSQLGFNSYGTGTGNVITGGGPSTTALQDPAFRDALGYAIDKERLLDRILGGYGEVGAGPIPPALEQWHVPPASPRRFDLAEAAARLTAAGYTKNGSGDLLDKDGKAISLRLVMPDSDDTYPDVAQFIVDWWGQLGIRVTPSVQDEGTLIELMLPPEAGDGYTADYDLFIWGWSGGPDPNALLQIFRCDAIGGSSDSMWCNPQYDQLYDQQLAAPDDATRHDILEELQELWYAEAPYHILYYDAATDAYRTDRFDGFQRQPADGTPFFTYDTLNYTLLTDAVAPAPSEAPSPSGAPAPTDAAPSPTSQPGPVEPGPDNTPLIVGGVAALVIVAIGAIALVRRRRGAAEEDE
jgi:peptide/nickel transport system substrate-binding protein